MKHHKKADKPAKADKADKGDKADKKGDAVVHVHHTGKPALKPVLHHAHGVDVGGAGHKEPKVEHGGIVQASLTTKPAHGKTASAHSKAEAKPAELPKLPNPNATKASKAGHEKGAKKPGEKKSEASGEKDGQPGRDGGFADLVAPVREKAVSKSDGGEKAASKSESGDKAVSKSDGGPKVASKTDGRARHVSVIAKVPACAKDPVEIVRGPEIDTFALTKCDGTLAPLAVEHLSVLIRPGSAARPTTPLAELAKKQGAELAVGVHRVDERLALRIQALADHFAKPGTSAKLSIVSGYRPTSIGSMHATGRAIDFRLEGHKNEDVVAFCKTLNDTGCGYYPNSSFVHLDVRDPGAGHVSWIDASGPGETPRYVTAWPPPVAAHPKGEALEPAAAREPAAKQESEEAPAAADEHPSSPPP